MAFIDKMEDNNGENSSATNESAEAEASTIFHGPPTPPTVPSWLHASLNQPFGLSLDDTASTVARSARGSIASPSRPREIKRHSGSPRLVVRNTASPLSTSLDRKRPAETTLMPTSMRMFSSEDDEMEERTDSGPTTTKTLEFIEKECVQRGWTGQKGRGRPTNDPFKLLALCSTEDPWHSRSLHLIDPQQLSCLLENVYVNNDAMCHGLQFVPRKGDLIACGVYRSGLTPAMQVLASLKTGCVVDKQHLVDMTDWLEAAHPSHSPSFRRNDPGDRLIRTHMPLRTLFGGVITPSPRGTPPEFHVVVMLRDPADIRLSWFRHVRRVYRKFHRGESNFDSHVRVDDFAGVHLYAANPNISSVTANHFDYENFVVECTKAVLEDHNSRILLCFYEELLVNPSAFVQRIAEFTGLCLDKPELLEEIARTLVEDEDFPSTFVTSATPISMHGLTPTASTISPTSTADDSSMDQTMPMIDIVKSQQELERHQNAHRHRKGCSGQGRMCFSKDSLRKFDFKWRDIVLVSSHTLTSYERLVFESSPIIRQLSPQGSVSSSASGSAVKRSPRGSFLGMHRAGLPRIGSFTSFFKTSKTPTHSRSAAAGEGASESADDTEVTTEEDHHSESDVHAQHLTTLFPGEDLGVAFSTTKPRSRTRTSSLLSLSSMFRETLNPPSANAGLLHSLAEDHPISRVTHQHHHHQEVDPDDSGEEDELNMFLDVKKSRIYERRTYHHHPVV